MAENNESSEDAETEESRPRRVLVVEDDEGLNNLAQKALREAGYDTEGVPNGAEAIERVMANPEVALLLDIRLPDITGSEVISAFIERDCPVPFIVMTGHGDERTAVEMMKLGAGDYLVKGLDLIDRLPGAFQRLFRELDTERRLHAAEEAMMRQQRAITLNSRIANVFLTSPPEGIYADVLDAILEALDSRIGYFGYIDDAGNLVCPSMTGDVWDQCQVADKRIVFLRGAWCGLSGRSLMEKRTLMANEGLRLPEGHVPLESALAVPIIHRATLIGQFVVANKPGGYDEYDQGLLESAAAQTAPVLNALLEEARQRQVHEKLEEQLRQAQKMEAVGQLAGGVAHDFNNLLQVIEGYGTMALDDLEPESPAREELLEVLAATERAAVLVDQLLAFSRRKVLSLNYLDVGRVVEGTMKMLGRVIGEHITFSYIPGHALGVIYADRGQIEQVLMNLCVNARDAMPDGGTITIETENVLFDEEYCRDHSWASPGRYVLLSVADTGCGMDEETLSRVFEPFFTTKEVGEGTGLGLATVYGIVKQHNGTVQTYSEVGKGTIFKVHLPIVERPASSVSAEVRGQAPGGTETILLAEDADSVRNLAKRILEKAGYTVLTAADGEEALRAYEEHADDIDLLLLDVVMPNIGGRAVYEKIWEKHSNVRVLFASGYSASSVHTNFILTEGWKLIQKPYKEEVLLRTVREVLDAEE